MDLYSGHNHKTSSRLPSRRPLDRARSKLICRQPHNFLDRQPSPPSLIVYWSVERKDRCLRLGKQVVLSNFPVFNWVSMISEGRPENLGPGGRRIRSCKRQVAKRESPYRSAHSHLLLVVTFLIQAILDITYLPRQAFPLGMHCEILRRWNPKGR